MLVVGFKHFSKGPCHFNLFFSTRLSSVRVSLLGTEPLLTVILWMFRSKVLFHPRCWLFIVLLTSRQAVVMVPPVHMFGNYRLTTSLDSRPNSKVYLGIDQGTGQEVAVKLETKPSNYPTLLYESKLFQILNAKGIRPKVLDYGVTVNGAVSYSYMVTEKLGSSVANLLAASGGQFTVSSTMKLAVNLLHLVESFHETCFLHRELKPDNIVIGNGAEADQLFLIDLELAAKYRSPQTHEHIPFRPNVCFIGNPVFASNNKILGSKSSRRDDLYSIGLMLIYFLRGCLPWSEVSRTRRRSAIDIVKEMKLTFPNALLTKGLPKPIGSLMGHAQALAFDARPDYDGLRQQFQKWSAHFGWDEQLPYDWMRSDQPASQEAISAVSAPASNDAVQSTLDSSDTRSTHSQLVGSTVQIASHQGTPANEDTTASASASATEGSPGGDAALASQGTPATENTLPHQTLDQRHEAEAKHAALASKDTHQASMKETETAATELPLASTEESASQAPSAPLLAAEKEDPELGSEATPTMGTDMRETTEFQQQSASEAAHATESAGVLRHPIADSHDPEDPYSMAFKVQPWPKRW